MYSQIVPSENTLLSYNEYINGKCEDIHNQIYLKSLDKFIELNPKYSINYSFVEIKNKDWKKPSKVILINKKYPFEKKTINLDNYWDASFVKEKSSSFENLIIDEDTIKDAEIIFIDYTKGNVTMRSKFTQKEFIVPFSRINGDTKINDEKCTLKGTFTYMTNFM